MTLNLLANVDPADILAYADAVPEPEDYLLTREIVPNTQIQSVRWRTKRSTRFSGTAKFRAFDTETPLGRREVTNAFTEGMLPPVGQKLFVGELETILLDLQRGADDAQLIDQLYDDAEANVQAIRARMELAAGDMLTDGIVTLNENNLILEADYAVPAGFKPTAGVYWTDPAAPMLDDEQAWIKYLIDNGAGRPGRAVTSATVAALFANNDQYKEDFFGRNQASYPTLTPGQVDSVRAARRLPPITEYDTKVRVDGANVRVLPENRFFLLPSDSASFAETQYGITAESIALSRTGNPRIEREDLPGIYVTVHEKDDPVSVWTKGSAVALPVMYDNTAYISARVIA
jgi:hypothetical protein